MNKPPLLPPAGKGAARLVPGGKIPGTYASDPEFLSKQILLRTGARKDSNNGSVHSETRSRGALTNVEANQSHILKDDYISQDFPSAGFRKHPQSVRSNQMSAQAWNNMTGHGPAESKLHVDVSQNLEEVHTTSYAGTPSMFSHASNPTGKDRDPKQQMNQMMRQKDLLEKLQQEKDLIR